MASSFPFDCAGGNGLLLWWVLVHLPGTREPEVAKDGCRPQGVQFRNDDVENPKLHSGERANLGVWTLCTLYTGLQREWTRSD
ncbi:uncharacterized protein TRAVEDRAFT_31381 [Trametes versicolor FP-101664 SS1]|uniref:uncharacterized protein n=1 Tax=Trametes versicolor (strain FP-101664) TaxID=717944 RepID=UPI0004624184|nr:uncharacterized protein TRAVEDRAFT_31381 [Trametes versicolor FP-101664 SS1]EIW54462.1 hypothetical protein TRAVEDRAFT_31381 [Trametes versicolor FP-101664 SS1]